MKTNDTKAISMPKIACKYDLIQDIKNIKLAN